MSAAASSRLLVAAIGGNAISPPRGNPSLGAERSPINQVAAELALLGRGGVRMLLVHGNGPQVGRLLAAPGVGDIDALDVHVAQTQGELGYLLVQALDTYGAGVPSVALITRVTVDANDPAFRDPTKPVGHVLPAPIPESPCAPTPDGHGWRRVIASPRPVTVVEQEAIRLLLAEHHVVAGGGGGIAVAKPGGQHALAAVIDKDWVASLLAIALDAAQLVFVTDVSFVYERFHRPGQQPILTMSTTDARLRLAEGEFAPGSMAPKVESAIQFAEATRRPAVITTLGAIAAALERQAGTTISA